MPGMRASWWMLAMLLMLAQARAWAAGIEDLVILHKLTARTQELVAERRYVEAAKVAGEALRFAKSRLGPGDREYGACVFNLAQVYAAMGEFTKAEQLHIQALGVFRKSRGPRHPDYVRGLSGLADLYEDMGEYARAESLLKEALEARRIVFGEEDARYARMLVDLAMLYYQMGDYAKAESLAKKAMVIGQTPFAEEKENAWIMLRSMDCLAIVYAALKEYGKAVPVMKLVSEITCKRQGESLAYTKAVGTLGVLYFHTGDTARAEELLLKVLALRKKLVGESAPEYANALSNLGVLYRSAGDYAKAEGMLNRALAIRRRTLSEDHPKYAEGLLNLALLYGKAGRYAEAEPLHKQATEIARKIYADTHPHCAEYWEALAELYVAWGRPEAARQSFNQELAALHGHAVRLLGGLSSLRQLRFMFWTWPKIETYLSFVRRHRGLPGLAAEAAQWVARWKALATEVQSQRLCSLQVLRDEESRPLVELLARTRRELAAISLNPPRDMKLDEVARRRRAAEQSLGAIEAELAHRYGDGARRHGMGQVRMEQIGTALPPGGVLLDFVEFREFRFGGEGEERAWGDDRYVVFVTRAQADQRSRGPAASGDATRANVALVDLGRAKPINEAVSAFAHAIRKAEVGPGAADEREIAATLRALTRQVLRPIATHITGTRHLIICPSGQLSLLPFGCLVSDDGRYLIESRVISYLCAGREAARYGAAPGRPARAGPALLVGDPDYDMRPEARRAELKKVEAPGTLAALRGVGGVRELGRVVFPPLPETRAEVEFAAKLIGGRTLIARQALEECVKRAASPEVLYLATHGFFLPDQEHVRPAAARLKGIAPEHGGGSDAGRRASLLASAARPVRNPLARCGLALAGAGRRTPPPESGLDDGLLTGIEVTGQDLRGTKLVVLSACQTALGDIKQGEGLMGLRRAFLLAGARRVLATHWMVPSKHTQELMQGFVRHWRAGAAPAEALRAAQLAMIKGLREQSGQAHPFFWAAFTLTGDWR